jgi:hypothetical protein
MRLLMLFAALVVWPFAAWHSLQARRRLRAHSLPSGAHPYTLERVA